MSARNTNPILDLLDDWKLSRLETRAQVIERVGLSPDPLYRDQTLLLKEAVTLPGAMTAWTASSFERIPLQFPISRFSELVWFVDNAHTKTPIIQAGLWVAGLGC